MAADQNVVVREIKVLRLSLASQRRRADRLQAELVLRRAARDRAHAAYVERQQILDRAEAAQLAQHGHVRELGTRAHSAQQWVSALALVDVLAKRCAALCAELTPLKAALKDLESRLSRIREELSEAHARMAALETRTLTLLTRLAARRAEREDDEATESAQARLHAHRTVA